MMMRRSRTVVSQAARLMKESSFANNGECIVKNVNSDRFSECTLKGFLEVFRDSSRQSCLNATAISGMKGNSRSQGFLHSYIDNTFRRCNPIHSLSRTLSSSSQSRQQATPEDLKKDLTTSEDPFDAPTYNIPEKPVTFTEGASYSIIILLGLAAAAAAAYAVFKELIFEPKEYKIYGKALERVQNDSQVRVRIGSPVTGYGQESRNRAARQRIAHKVWTDEDGVEHIEVNFYVRGPHGAGRVYSEMFKDKVDREWKFTYLIVDVMSPSQTRLMLESYVPA